MKKFILLSFLALSVSLVSAQDEGNTATIKVAYGLDSLNYPQYGDVYLMDGESDFYIIAEDVAPIQCNKLKLYAYYKDLTNGLKANDYWVYQGVFDFTIVPYYKSYSLNLKAYKMGEYKMVVSGYTNDTYTKNFGVETFTIKDGNLGLGSDVFLYLLNNF